MSSSDQDKKDQTVIIYQPSALQTIIGIAVIIASIWVTYRCKGDVSLVEIIAAVCCSPCYVIYALYLLFSEENKGCGILR